MKIVLVRHGAVEEAYHKRYNGEIDIALSKGGEEEAIRLAKCFKDETFDAIYCSDLRRAKETLSPFVQSRDAIYTTALREKSWGRHEGLSFDEIIAEGEIEYKNFLQWIEALDGEPYALYVQRVQQFFLEFLINEQFESVLVVTHAGVIRTLISLVEKISLEEAFSVDIPYGSFIIFDTKEMNFSKSS